MTFGLTPQVFAATMMIVAADAPVRLLTAVQYASAAFAGMFAAKSLRHFAAPGFALHVGTSDFRNADT